MIDTFEYKSPFGILGVVADKLFLGKYMKRFIDTRAKELKRLLKITNGPFNHWASF